MNMVVTTDNMSITLSTIRPLKYSFGYHYGGIYLLEIRIKLPYIIIPILGGNGTNESIEEWAGYGSEISSAHLIKIEGNLLTIKYYILAYDACNLRYRPVQIWFKPKETYWKIRIYGYKIPVSSLSIKQSNLGTVEGNGIGILKEELLTKKCYCPYACCGNHDYLCRGIKIYHINTIPSLISSIS